MREIKFRAWDIPKRKMRIVNRLGIFLKKIQIAYIFRKYKTDTGEFKYLENNKYKKEMELMQYTGLEDKNGKEIYEGDIIKSMCKDVEIIHEVKFDIIDGYNWEHLDMETLEVIGNKYENPELLE